MSGHKYFEDIGETPWGHSLDICVDEKGVRQKKWAEQRKIYGFDERETWSLNYCFYVWLYERLCMYLEKASPIIDLDYYKFTYKGETLTQREWILRLQEYLKDYLKEPDPIGLEKNHALKKKLKDIGNIWNMILPCMWW